jgi:hypothetical protein
MGQVYQCWWRICRKINYLFQFRISHVLRLVCICDLFADSPSYHWFHGSTELPRNPLGKIPGDPHIHSEYNSEKENIRLTRNGTPILWSFSPKHNHISTDLSVVHWNYQRRWNRKTYPKLSAFQVIQLHAQNINVGFIKSVLLMQPWNRRETKKKLSNRLKRTEGPIYEKSPVSDIPRVIWKNFDINITRTAFVLNLNAMNLHWGLMTLFQEFLTPSLILGE